MSLFDRVIDGTVAWLDDLDRERDATARALAEGPADLALTKRLIALEQERTDVVALLAHLKELQAKNLPALLFDVRPRRMLNVPLRRRRQCVRKGA